MNGEGYLSLTRYEGEFIIAYREDNNRNPILTENDVLIMKVVDIENGRVKLVFNGKSYHIVRIEVLQGVVKDFVDKKIKRLEERVN